MSVELFECVALTEGGALRVDREAGTIGPVKVLGWRSLNGRDYDPAGVDPKVYEGCKVCIDHVKPGAARSTRDTIGVLEGCSKTASGIYADRLRLFHPKGDYEQRLLGAAAVAPNAYGLSHTARGREKPGSGGAVIEAVEQVSTVDVVDDPATVSGLYESRSHAMKRTFKQLIESLAATRPDYARALKEMAEAGIASPDTPMDEPAGTASGGDHEAALKSGFRAAINAALDDEGMDLKAKIKKIKEILQMEEKMLDKGKGGEGEPPATEESRRVRDRLAVLEARDLLRGAADEAGVKLGKAVLESVSPTITAEQAKAFVAELKGAGLAAGQKPRSAAPVTPGGVTAGRGGGTSVQESKLPEGADGKAVGRWLSGK